MNCTFKGKRVLITGAGKGLGATIVDRLCSDGAIVFAMDKDASLLSFIKEKHPSVTTLQVDLRNWEETQRAVESIGPIDHLVNNAGVVNTPDFQDINESDVNLIMDTNFKACISVSQAAAKQMSPGSSMVNVSSILGKITSEGLGLYSCSKAALNMLTKSMALELGQKGIRVNAVCPSAMMTDLMLTMAAKNPTKDDSGIQRFVIKRLVEKDEVVDSIFFLLSDKSSMITGQKLYIEGGLFTN